MKCWEESCEECEYEEPCVRGGQGRDADSVIFDATCFGVSILLIAVLIVVIAIIDCLK